MKKREINPTPWLQAFGINHGVEITGADRVLYLSGQTSTAGDGTTMHAGDLPAQFRYAWENVLDALKAADMTAANVVRLKIFTTDSDTLMSHGAELFGLLGESGCKPSATLIGVATLYDPSIMVELEATAVA